MGMKVQWAVPIIASILILGTIGVTQMVYAQSTTEYILILAVVAGYVPDTEEFEIKVLVHLPKGSDFAAFTVDTTLDLFKPDGTPIRVGLTTSDPVPAGVKEGGNNNSIHKLIAKISYVPPEELLGEKIRVKITSDLSDPSGNNVSGSVKWANITLKRG